MRISYINVYFLYKFLNKLLYFKNSRFMEGCKMPPFTLQPYRRNDCQPKGGISPKPLSKLTTPRGNASPYSTMEGVTATKFRYGGWPQSCTIGKYIGKYVGYMFLFIFFTDCLVRSVENSQIVVQKRVHKDLTGRSSVLPKFQPVASHTDPIHARNRVTNISTLRKTLC